MRLHGLVPTAFRRTDLPRWRETARELPSWDQRNRMIAALIPAERSVLDLGAGSQSLRQLLTDCVYQPCDVVQNTDDTLLLDFNHGVYPSITDPFDYVVLSGVIEYARDPADLLRHAVSFGRRIIVSYAVRSRHEVLWWRRFWRRRGFFTHMFREEFEALFEPLGVSYSVVGEWHGQLIYLLESP